MFSVGRERVHWEQMGLMFIMTTVSDLTLHYTSSFYPGRVISFLKKLITNINALNK